MNRADALVIVSPEYNHGYPGLLKHVLDTNLKEYIHKAAGVVGVSAGVFGGARVIQNLIPVLRELGLVTIFWDVNFTTVGSRFDEDGNLLDDSILPRIDMFLDELLWMAETLRYGREHVTIGGSELNMPLDDLSEVRSRDEPPGRQARPSGRRPRRLPDMTPALDGVIEHVFACPDCGRIESRRVSLGSGRCARSIRASSVARGRCDSFSASTPCSASSRRCSSSSRRSCSRASRRARSRAPGSRSSRPVARLVAVVVARAAAWSGASRSRDGAPRSTCSRSFGSTSSSDGCTTGRRPSTAPESAEIAAAAVTGVDALETTFARYLPQVVLALVVPVAVLALVAAIDLVAAGVMLLTLPLVPLFMWLVGRYTERQTRDAVAGARRCSRRTSSTSSAGCRRCGRSTGAAARPSASREVSEQYRRTTMSTLRVAFLSGTVLELAATLGIALVAVTVGVRLVDGRIGFEPALTVLVLAPELYLPLRNLAAQFHASADTRAVDRPPARPRRRAGGDRRRERPLRRARAR